MPVWKRFISSIPPQEFFLPELQEMSERYGGLGMHCCADATHQWPGVLQIPGLRFLNLIQPADRIREAIPYFMAHLAQWHGVMGEDPGGGFMGTGFPEAHLVLEATVGTRAEAVALADRLRLS